MRAFSCGNCGQLVFFENSLCLRCQTPLGFESSTLEIVALKDERADEQRCANLLLAECNWLVEDDNEEGLCRSCRVTTIRPNDDDPEGLKNFASAEAAKRRVLYQLIDIGLPVDDDTLSFELRSSTTEPVTTGHADGVVTLDLAESDDANRVARREQLGEPYRTMIGHFRHELGHYYQDVLLTDDSKWDRCREVFGDEREDYSEAMNRHYETGPPADWPDHFVSAYATMHAWEDWAETFAHYLHIRDTLQTAADFGMRIDGPHVLDDGHHREFKAAPRVEVGEHGFREILDNWLPLTYALNQVNRSMGHDDLYPFALSDTVIEKLAFMHDRVHAIETGAELPAPPPGSQTGEFDAVDDADAGDDDSTSAAGPVDEIDQPAAVGGPSPLDGAAPGSPTQGQVETQEQSQVSWT